MSKTNTTATITEEIIWSEFDTHGVESLLLNIRSNAFGVHFDSLDRKKYYKTKSWLSNTGEVLEALLPKHFVVVPSEEFLRNNPNHEGLFNVSLTPDKKFVKQLLINLTAFLNYDPRRRDVAPLAILCALPSIEPRTVKYLLDNGIEVNSKARTNATALLGAAYSGNLPVVKLLIEKGAFVEDGFEVPFRPIYESRFYHRFIQIFSNKKYPLPYYFTIHFSPLLAAVSEGHAEVAKYLVDHGADRISGNQILHLTFPPILRKDLNLMNVIFQYAIDVTTTDLARQTILHKTAVKGDCEVSKLLLKYKTDVTATDYFGWTPLHFAALYARNDSKPLINLLLDNGGDINAETDGGFTPLNLLEAGRDKSFLKYLKVYLRLTSTNNSISRPPSETNSQPELIRLFLDRGANVDHQDRLLGWSTLHWAAAIGDTPVVKLLVEEYRANVTSKSKKCWTPSYTAKHFNMTEVSEYLAMKESTQH